MIFVILLMAGLLVTVTCLAVIVYFIIIQGKD